jgi:UDP-glucose 4-epimerase
LNEQTKKILITGANGFIGRHLSRACAEEGGHFVMGLGHGNCSEVELARWGIRSTLNGDVAGANLDRLAEEHGMPDAIFHLAGGSAVGPSMRVPTEDFRRTANSTCELLDWVRVHTPKTPVILASSAAVYGANHAQAIAECDATLPFSPYGYHKRMAELLCDSYSHNFGLQTRIVRLFSVYGPYLRKQLLWDTCQRLKYAPQPLVMNGSGNEVRDWLHVRDCVALLRQVAECSSTQRYFNGGTGVPTPVHSVVKELCVQWGGRVEPEFNGQSRPGDPHSLVANNAQAASIGWSPKTDWKQGVAEYVDWFRRTQ